MLTKILIYLIRNIILLHFLLCFIKILNSFKFDHVRYIHRKIKNKINFCNTMRSFKTSCLHKKQDINFYDAFSSLIAFDASLRCEMVAVIFYIKFKRFIIRSSWSVKDTMYRHCVGVG